MSTEIENQTQPSTASLVSGILGDLTQLVEQQLLLTRREIEQEIRDRVSGVVIFGLGAGTLFLAAIIHCLALSHLLHSIALPPGSDLARVPLWASYAIVGTGLAIVGGSLVFIGRAKFLTVTSPLNSTTKVLQEHRR